jgi:hypothetical protein
MKTLKSNAIEDNCTATVSAAPEAGIYESLPLLEEDVSVANAGVKVINPVVTAVIGSLVLAGI